MKKIYITPKAEAIYCSPSTLAAGSGNSTTPNTPTTQPGSGDPGSSTDPGFPHGAKRNLVGWSAGDGWDRIGM